MDDTDAVAVEGGGSTGTGAKTLRRKLIAWPARIVRNARETFLHGPAGWPWAHEANVMLARLRAIPAPT